MNEVVIYESVTNQIEVSVEFEKETVWLNLNQIAALFDRDKSVISRHLKNIFQSEELQKDEVVAFFATTTQHGAIKGKTQTKQVEFYNLDAILSVGYRVNSKQGTQFRIWANKVLKAYLLQGYAINQELLQSKTEKIKELESHIDNLNEVVHQTQKQITQGFLSIIDHYSKSFELLNKYDSEELSLEGLNDDVIYKINYSDVKKAIQELKNSLIEKGEASAIFGNEKDKSFEGILGSISQTVFGKLAYPTIEEQAAQLLYSIIKGHAFNDGNKRIGSFIFVWFLEQNNFHLNANGKRKIDDNALVALALAVAQSLPEQRDLIIKLIINLIKTN